MNRKTRLGFAMLLLIACTSPQGVAAQPFDTAEAPSPEQWREQLLAAHQEIVRAHKRHQAALDAYRLM